jgi:Ca-activated chloride channel family protein
MDMNMKNLSFSLSTRGLIGAALSLTLGAGCASDVGGFGGSGFDGSGVGQGGAQDFGLFRQILESGEIPGPETIDDVGFFNEHVIELPPAECGQDICVHGHLGVMANLLSGANCTMIMVGMNSPIDIAEMERPPLNLAIAVDVSGSMMGDSLQSVVRGLQRMLPVLSPSDQITLVPFSSQAEVAADHLLSTDPGLDAAIDGLRAEGNTNIYDGLRVAFEAIASTEDPTRQNRVILLSDGVATAGLTSESKITNLAVSYAEIGIGLTTIGVGSEFDVKLMRSLAEQGAGSFYFLEDPSAVEEVFVEEVESFVMPVAEDVRMDVDVSAGYDLRAVYGTKRGELIGNTAVVDIPILQLASRQSDEDQAHGRRGGGGVMIFEVLPNGGTPDSVGELSMSYRHPVTGNTHAQEVKIDSPLAVGETPAGGWFDGSSTEKSFVMLNIYVAFEMAAERAAAGDDFGALAVLRAVQTNGDAWLEDHPDADIADDLVYVGMFIENLEARSQEPQGPTPVPEPWPHD